MQEDEMKHHHRRVEDVVVLDLKGRLVAGESTIQLRHLIHDLLDRGEKQILLNLDEVRMIDVVSTTEIIHAKRTAFRAGASIKLLNLTRRLREIPTYAMLIAIFEDFSDLAEAVHSFWMDRKE